METTKLKVSSVSEMITNNAVFLSPKVSSSISSVSMSSRSSRMSKGANLAPQEIRIDFAVLPETCCKGIFSTLLKKSYCEVHPRHLSAEHPFDFLFHGLAGPLSEVCPDHIGHSVDLLDH